MRSTPRLLIWTSLLALGSFATLSIPPVRADSPAPRRDHAAVARSASHTKSNDPAKSSTESAESDDPPTIDVLEGLRTGQIAADAEGLGDGRMTLSLTNRTNKPLRVVLPPGLIASGATGQFGGMGGMMGGMGGMGMGGMGMGGMGMGGMGGGMMGGMGGMMGGRGGMMGGMGGRGMMGGGTLPASMGMMMLGRLIMTLIGDRDSWDMRSLMMGMMGGMGMGGMGMGGMGGGMMGGGMMGGGFRSVPPTGLPEATLKPRQTRHLPTTLVSLAPPAANDKVAMPPKGEKLQIGEIGEATGSARTQKALKRLAEDKAPQTVSQLVMWNVSAGMDWTTIAQLSRTWANDHERALARDFVDRLDLADGEVAKDESGTFYCEIKSEGTEHEALAGEVRKLIEKYTLLGLKTKLGVPASPTGPAMACRAELSGTKAEPKLLVHVAITDGKGTGWGESDKFTIDLAKDKGGEVKPAAVADAMASETVARLIHAKLTKGPKVKGKETYRVRIVNSSPFILNGLAVAGPEDASKTVTALAGLCIPPRKSLTVPAGAETVEKLDLKDGIRVIAADLSGL